MSYRALSLSKKQAYYDEWLLSGELQPQFLKRKNLGPSTFKADGLKRGKSMPTQQPVHTLLPVQVKPMEATTQPVGLCVQFPNGARLHFTTEVPAQYAGDLLAAMEPGSSC